MNHNILNLANQSPTKPQELALALEATQLAVDYYTHHSGNFQILSQEKKDIKISLDIEIEQLVINFLKARSPFPILGEETAQDFLTTNPDYHTLPFLWVLDPIDGTYNFSRNLFPHAFSLALLKDGNPILGVIYDFNSKSTLWGAVGFGSFRGMTPIAVSSCELNQAVLCTGFPNGFSEEELAAWYKEVNQFKKVRMFGSATYSTMLVAEGKADCYLERSINIWDVAAGLALILASGGEVKISKALGAKKSPFQLNVRAWAKSLNLIHQTSP